MDLATVQIPTTVSTSSFYPLLTTSQTIPPPPPRLTCPPLLFVTGMKNFNKYFPAPIFLIFLIMSMPQNTVENQIEKILAIYKLSGEFENAAKKSAVTIITEVAMANHLKSIPSIDAGGIAGGEKYIHQGNKYIYSNVEISRNFL